MAGPCATCPVVIATATRINLAGDCRDAHCLHMAGELKAQLDPKYSRGAAVMPLTDAQTYLDEHRTLRRRALRAYRLGYDFATLIERQLWAGDIHEVNTSAERRQGRPMSKGYLEPPVFGANPFLCPAHHVYTYGIVKDGRLWAYLWLYRCGDLAMVSSILGHADKLDDGIMYLLWRDMIRKQAPLGGTVFYNLWNSGTDGLRFFKERVGLEEGDVEWAL